MPIAPVRALALPPGFARHKFLCLLFLAVAYPLALIGLPDNPLLLVPFDLVMTGLTVAILFATGHWRRLVGAAGVLAILLTLANALAVASATFAESTVFAIFRTSLLVGFFSAATVVVLTNVLDRERVSMEKVLGGVCAYLFIGSIWGFLYMLIVLVDPDAFRGATLGTPSGSNGIFNWYDLELAEFTYFSYVTLSTLGYGDITPRSVAAQMLVWMEALIGQIYLAVLIARLVSLQIVHSGLEAAEGEGARSTAATRAQSQRRLP